MKVDDIKNGFYDLIGYLLVIIIGIVIIVALGYGLWALSQVWRVSRTTTVDYCISTTCVDNKN